MGVFFSGLAGIIPTVYKTSKFMSLRRSTRHLEQPIKVKENTVTENILKQHKDSKKKQTDSDSAPKRQPLQKKNPIGTRPSNKPEIRHKNNARPHRLVPEGVDEAEAKQFIKEYGDQTSEDVSDSDSLESQEVKYQDGTISLDSALSLFQRWAALYQKPSYAKVLANQVRRLFADGSVTQHTFRSTKNLYTDTRRFILAHKNAAAIVPEGRENVKGGDHLQVQSSNTVAKYVKAIEWFFLFCGHTPAKNLVDLCRLLSTRARNQFESEFMSSLLQFNVTVNRLNTITLILRRQVELVIQQLKDWREILFQPKRRESEGTRVRASTARPTAPRLATGITSNFSLMRKLCISMTKCGRRLLQPLILLSLMLYVAPLGTDMFLRMIYLENRSWSGNNKSVATYHQQRKVGGRACYLIKGDDQNPITEIAFQMPADHTGMFSSQLVRIELPQWLADLVRIYVKCSNIPDTHRAFYMGKAKMTEYLHTYVKIVGINESWLGYGTHTFSYQMKLLWVMRRTYKQASQTGLVSLETVDCLSRCGMIAGISPATSQYNQYYSALNELRALVNSVQFYQTKLGFEDTKPKLPLYKVTDEDQNTKIHEAVLEMERQWDLILVKRPDPKPKYAYISEEDSEEVDLKLDPESETDSEGS